RATSHEPRATSHQPPATSHQPLATSHQPPFNLICRQMPLLLTTDWFLTNCGERLETVIAGSGLQPITLPRDGARLAQSDIDAVEVAFFHGDFRSDPNYTRRFFGTALHAPRLRWMHLPNSGV